MHAVHVGDQFLGRLGSCGRITCGAGGKLQYFAWLCGGGRRSGGGLFSGRFGAKLKQRTGRVRSIGGGHRSGRFVLKSFVVGREHLVVLHTGVQLTELFADFILGHFEQCGDDLLFGGGHIKRCGRLERFRPGGAGQQRDVRLAEVIVVISCGRLTGYSERRTKRREATVSLCDRDGQ